MKKKILSIFIVMFSLVVTLAGGFLLSGCDSDSTKNSNSPDDEVSESSYSGYWSDSNYFSDGASDFEYKVTDKGFFVYIDRACELAKYAYICNKTSWTVSGTYNGINYEIPQNEAHIILTADIDLEDEFNGYSKYWIPIGVGTRPFKGTFDGNGFTISNMHCWVTNTSASNYLYNGDYYYGLFGCWEGMGYYKEVLTIENVVLKDPHIYTAGERTSSSKVYIGTLVANIDTDPGLGNENNISKVGIVRSSGYFILSYESLVNETYLGGLVGASIGGGNNSIDSCFVQGQIISNGADDVLYPYNCHGGGIIGAIKGKKDIAEVTIKNCYFYGHINIYGFGRVGGIVGEGANGNLNCCYYYDTSTPYLGTQYAGGIAGVFHGKIYRCFFSSTGDMLDVNYTFGCGGIVGFADDKPTIKQCAYYTTTSSLNAIGGGSTSTNISYRFTEKTLITASVASSFFTSTSYLGGGTSEETPTWSIPEFVSYTVDESYTWTRVYGMNGRYPMLSWYATKGKSSIVTYETDGGTISGTPNQNLYVQSEWVSYHNAQSITHSYTANTDTHTVTISPADGYEIIGIPVYIPDLSKTYKLSFSYTSPAYTSDGNKLEMHIASTAPGNNWNSYSRIGKITIGGTVSSGTVSADTDKTVSYTFTPRSFSPSSSEYAITNNTIYIYLNAGHMTDGQGKKEFQFKNFKVSLVDSKNLMQVVQEGHPYGKIYSDQTKAGNTPTLYKGENLSDIMLSASTSDNNNTGNQLTITSGRTYLIHIGRAQLNSYTASTKPTQFSIEFFDNTKSTTLISQTATFGNNISIKMTCPSEYSGDAIWLRLYAGVKGSTAGNSVSFYGISYISYVTNSTNYTNTVYDKSTSTSIASKFAGTASTLAGPSNITLFTVWKLYTCKINFDLNGGSGSVPSSITKAYGVYVTLPTISASRTGYTANGWNTSKTLTTSSNYTAGGVYSYNPSTDGETITLYVNWKPVANPVQIRFMLCDTAGSTIYSYKSSPGSGFSVDFKYSNVNNLSGNSVSSTQTVTTVTGTTTFNYVHASSNTTYYIQNIKCPENYVFVYAMRSTNSYSSYSYTGSMGGDSFSYSWPGSTTTTTRYIYVFFKKVDGAQLKYDTDDQYFYFEDGEFPQTAVCTYDNEFQNELANLSDADLDAHTTESGETVYYLEWTENLKSLHGYADYVGQRFLGVKLKKATTVKLKVSGVLTEVSFSANTKYWFRFDPIRWRVSAYGTTYIPSRWSSGKVADSVTSSQGDLKDTGISDVLWYDALETGELKGGNANNYGASDVLKNFTGNFFDFEHSHGDWYDLDQFNTSGSSGNQKVTETYAETDTSTPRIANLREIKYNIKNNYGDFDLKSYGSQLVCVLMGVDQNVPVEYWTRDLGQTIGNGTYVTSSGEIITSSGYNQTKGIRFCKGFKNIQRGPTVPGSDNLISGLWNNGTWNTTNRTVSYDKDTQEYTITSNSSGLYSVNGTQYVYLRAGESYSISCDAVTDSSSSSSIYVTIGLSGPTTYTTNCSFGSTGTYSGTKEITPNYTGVYRLQIGAYVPTTTTTTIIISNLKVQKL